MKQTPKPTRTYKSVRVVEAHRNYDGNLYFQHDMTEMTPSTQHKDVEEEDEEKRDHDSVQLQICR